MRVAWIGLGSMGRPMALSVVRGGHELRGYARRPEEHAQLVAEGASVGDDPVAAVLDAELVCVNLFSEAQVRAVLIDGGVLAAVPAGAIVAIHSTVSPAFVNELATVRGDVELIDAGFSGGPDEAQAGALTLMVGGDPTAFDQAWEVFRTYADHIAYAGPLGSGMTLKVINNLTFAANLAIASDALRLVTATGVDPEIAAGVLMRGSAGSTALRIIAKNGAPEAAMTAIARYLEKDVAIARAATVGLDLGTLGDATSGYAA
ncbi:NAD(P)-dependent oxidoreductase [uncultured Sphingomonas sp.]|uniref:NAD(P)-dependent oxidoreductase n=1 Tax=uncultured Sphingomonas sp. TaxID=158754 RepID=UPI0026326ACD|nr:NAD(P)-dependent oxidoreductase [uncultured Sphingomonas sp.]